MAENYTLLVAALSILVNIIIIAILGFTGIGSYSVKRFFNKMKVRRGTHTASLMITKNGVIKEVCQPVDEKELLSLKTMIILETSV